MLLMLSEWQARQITIQLTIIAALTLHHFAESGCYGIVGWCQVGGGQGGPGPPQEAAGDGDGIC